MKYLRLVFVSVCLSACGGTHGEVSDQQVASAALSATCTVDDAVSSERCAGGYTYRKHGVRHRLMVSSACPATAYAKKKIPAYPECNDREFGPALEEARHINHVTGHVTWPDGGHPLADIRRRGFKYPRNMSPAEVQSRDPAAWQQLSFLVADACPQAFQPIYHRWLSNHHHECLESKLVLGGIRYLSEAYLGENNWGRHEARVAPFTCFYNEVCVKAWNRGTGRVCGEATGWVNSAEDDKDQPTAWAACRDPSHGDEPDSDVVLPTLYHSPATSLQALAQAEPYVADRTVRCTTCDSMPMGDKATTRAKFICLQRQLSDAAHDRELNHGDKVTIKREVQRSMRLLAELGGQHTNFDQRREVVQAWDAGRGTAPKCGPDEEASFLVGESPECASLAQVDYEALACARLVNAQHVVAASWAPFAQTCATSVRTLLSEGQECLAPGAATRLEQLRRDIVAKALSN